MLQLSFHQAASFTGDLVLDTGMSDASFVQLLAKCVCLPAGKKRMIGFRLSDQVQ